MESKNKIIYSMKIMLKLVERGFYPIQTLQNPKDIKYNCWVFELNDNLQKVLDELIGGTQSG